MNVSVDPIMTLAIVFRTMSWQQCRCKTTGKLMTVSFPEATVSSMSILTAAILSRKDGDKPLSQRDISQAILEADAAYERILKIAYNREETLKKLRRETKGGPVASIP